MKGTGGILSARALMSAEVSNWLATAPRSRWPQAINTHFARLGAIAARQPGLAEEIRQIEQAVMRAANENVGFVSPQSLGAMKKRTKTKPVIAARRIHRFGKHQ